MSPTKPCELIIDIDSTSVEQESTNSSTSVPEFPQVPSDAGPEPDFPVLDDNLLHEKNIPLTPPESPPMIDNSAHQQSDDQESEGENEFLENCPPYPGKRPIPLKNLSVNCYMNAAFQCLLPAFIELSKYEDLISLPSECSAFTLMKEFIHYYDHQQTFSIPEFIMAHSNLRYFGHELDWANQEDAQEFLNCYLDRFKEELHAHRDCVSPFEITHDCRYFCDSCSKSNSSSPKFVADQSIFVNFGKNMDEMIKESLVAKVDGYNCENCLIKDGSASSSTVFSRIPYFLVVCIKRFVQNDLGFIEKMSDTVDIEEFIEVEFLRDGEVCVAKYELMSVVNHVGTIDQGHYYAYVKHDSQWFEAEDENITPMDFTQVQKYGGSTNYLQLYRIAK